MRSKHDVAFTSMSLSYLHLQHVNSAFVQVSPVKQCWLFVVSVLGMYFYIQAHNLGSQFLKSDKSFKMKYLKEPLSQHSSLSGNLGYWATRSEWLVHFQISEVECWTFHVCVKVNPKIPAARADVISCNLMFTRFYFIKFEMFLPMFLLPIRDPVLP